jgi:hypothetical protein
MDKILYKVVYHHIIYMCDFLVNLDDFFAVVCTVFHKSYSFHPIYSQSVKPRSPRQHNYLLDVLIIYFL